MSVFDQGAKIAHFAFVFGGQNEENLFKIESKNVLFLSIELEGLSFDFRFILESKNRKKIAIDRTN